MLGFLIWSVQKVVCTHTQSCQLYAQFAADPGLKLWRQHYCESNYKACARYQVALSGKAIPLTLLPNGKLLQRYRKRDELNAAALFNAIQKGRLAIVKSLLNGKISSAAIKMADGTTPLMAAAERGNAGIVKLLLEAGYSPLQQNDKGVSAMDIARQKGFADCADLMAPYVRQQSNEANHTASTNSDSGILSEVLSFLRKLNPVR